MIYAGIGPRVATALIRDQMTQLGIQLEELGFMLSSGDGIGSDQAWAEEVRPENTRIMLAEPKPNCPHGIVPDFLQEQWSFCNLHFGKFRTNAAGKPLSLASQNDYVQKLFMRNLNILLGADLANPVPVDFVAYWYGEDCPNGWAGGTGHTVSMARDPEINIPCFNIHLEKDREAMDKFVEQLLEKKA